jgi:hypothetical protein
MTEPVRTSRIQMPDRIKNLGQRERILAVVLIVAVLLAVVFLVFSGGGGTKFEPITSPTVGSSPTASPSPTSPPETGEQFEGKDPFQPLVVAIALPSGGPTPSQTPGPTTGVTGGSTTTPAMTVTLLNIFTQGGKRFATVEVDGKDYTAGVGETFATNFRVISLSSSCGTFVFGDERFSLCVGQEVRK